MSSLRIASGFLLSDIVTLKVFSENVTMREEQHIPPLFGFISLNKFRPTNNISRLCLPSGISGRCCKL